MKKQFYYDSLEEKEKIINENNNLYVENELLTNELKGEIL
ncbi:Uncharacterised protein [Clostridioides difficile]|nr:Uncharacterised protein [Clostridioides difficile]